MRLAAALEARVSREAATLELARHGWAWDELRIEAGREPEPGPDGLYLGRDILEWLGY